MNLKCREKVVIAVEKSSQSWRAQDSLLRSAAAAAVVAFLRATAVTTARISNASCIDSAAYCLKSIFPCASCHSCGAQLPVLFSFFRVKLFSLTVLVIIGSCTHWLLLCRGILGEYYSDGRQARKSNPQNPEQDK